MDILDWLTILSYVAINTDLVLQTVRIYRRKSSEDLSLVGMTIRFTAVVIILVKLLTLGDMPLIIGHAISLLTFCAYFVLAILYFRRRRAKAR